jgi:hypothetical protein
MRFQVVGDRIEYEAPHQPPAALLERLRAHRAELLALLTVPNPGPFGYGQCFRCGRELPDEVAIGECAPCRVARGAPLVCVEAVQ